MDNNNLIIAIDKAGENSEDYSVELKIKKLPNGKYMVVSERVIKRDNGIKSR